MMRKLTEKDWREAAKVMYQAIFQSNLLCSGRVLGPVASLRAIDEITGNALRTMNSEYTKIASMALGLDEAEEADDPAKPDASIALDAVRSLAKKRKRK